MSQKRTSTPAIPTRNRRRGAGPRSLRFDEWPGADQRAWSEACRPGSRFKRGGVASRLGDVSRADIARRYGAFLGFLERNDRLNGKAPATSQVTLENVRDYLTELQGRVSSVTVWNCFYKLRRAAEVMAPRSDFSWLGEMENDLALVMQPRSKFDRFVLTEVLVAAGLNLIEEAEKFGKTELARAKGARNGLIVALLALCPIRIKNFASLEVGSSMQEIGGEWWIVLSRAATKTGRPDSRRIPEFLKQAVDRYVYRHRPVLARSHSSTNALWLSSTTGKPMTIKNLGILVSKLTMQTLGIDVSPHLFRTAAASTAAIDGSNPHLASALLNHTDPRVTEEHYNRATTLSAAQAYAAIMQQYRARD